MNILKEYTLDYVRRNKKSSIAIMIAILIATTMLSALCGALHTYYTDEIRLTILEKGNWHAELFDNTSGDKLKYVTGHPNVESVMIKGTWEIAKIDDPRRPYLVMRGLTLNYWNDMPEHTAILEGRIPQSEDELAISKQYFENHPELNIGDTISLPIGSRIFNNEHMDFSDPLKEGELFTSTKECTYIIVAKLDVTTNSMTPAYVAYGYIDEANIQPDDQLTVYMRFKNPRTTYEDIIQIAQSVGYKADEYGDYMVKTNGSLLAKYLILSPEQKEHFDIWQLSRPLMFIAFALLVAGVFVLIIHNAFDMSVNARLKQLGMLQSIGASPKQIRQSVIFEALILSLIPITIGLFIGWALDYSLFAYLNSVEIVRERAGDIMFVFGLPAALPSIVLAILTVLLSAMIPARKIAKLLPIEAIRQNGYIKIKKMKKYQITTKLFGIEGELAQNALYARKKSYRTAAISLTLSFALFSVFMNFMAISEAWREVSNSGTWKESQRHLSLSIQDGNITSQEFEEEIRSIDGVKNVLFLMDVPAGLWVTEKMCSQEFQSSGGFEKVSQIGKYDIYEDNKRFRIRTNLTALDDESFAEYCAEIGVEPSMFYDTQTPRTIVVNNIQDAIRSNRRNPVQIPFLTLDIGDKLNCEEKIYPEDTATYTFQTEVGFLTRQMPKIDLYNGGYQLTQVMPRSVYLSIAENFQEKRALRAKNVYVPIMAQSEELIQPVADKLQSISDRWYGSGDYGIWNSLEREQVSEKSTALMKTIMLCVSVFLALIGCSNVFSTVSANLRQRQKELAMLRSVGISPKGIRRMLTLEALTFGFMPIILNIPLNVIVVFVFLKINLIYLKEFLPFAPFLPIIIFGALILLSVVLAYAISGRKLRRDAIVDVLKDESV